jgi:type IV pilus assembly protein PilB
VLTGTGKISPAEIEAAINRFDKDSEDVWRSFVNSKRVTEMEVFQSLANISALEFADIRNVQIDAEVLATLSPSFCRREKLIPIAIKGDFLLVAVDNPNNFKALDEIAVSTSYKVVLKVVTPSALQDVINRFYRSDDEIEKLSEELEQVAAGEEPEVVDEAAEIEEESPVVRFVNLLISQAIRDRASDIHVEPGAHELRVRYRIDGVLHEVQRADKGIQNGVISRLKIMSDIDIAEKRKTQDGRISIKHAGQNIDIRVVTIPVIWGEKIVMRIMDHSGGKRDISSIGMSKRNEEIFKDAIARPNGLVLVTGPTGSGKSTTLYVVLDEVANSEVNVMTVEDPIEKRLDGINQTQINEKAGVTFSSVLPGILRADPDVVLLGEIRDEETAKIAVKASMTGHLVLTTLHTNGAPEAAARLVEMGVEPYLVGSSVTCVIAQRLARRLCEDCKIQVDPSLFDFESLSFPHIPTDVFFGPSEKGCSSCSETGFRGRVALTEVMEVNEEIEALITARQSARVIRTAAERSGLVPLRKDGWDKVKLGITTIEEVLRVTT